MNEWAYEGMGKWVSGANERTGEKNLDWGEVINARMRPRVYYILNEADDVLEVSGSEG